MHIDGDSALPKVEHMTDFHLGKGVGKLEVVLCAQDSSDRSVLCCKVAQGAPELMIYQ